MSAVAQATGIVPLMAASSATTIRHKAGESHTIAVELAQFQAAGGRIQKLGNTPLRPSKTRRETIQAKSSSKGGKR